tara:strand:+ start:484 stop:720 length:237 start_codon:yes stop_codon:yes gene_type:complete
MVRKIQINNTVRDMTPEEEAQLIKDAENNAIEEQTTGYKRKRRNEYPSIEDQLDDIYHNGIDGWKVTIKVTKDKYPKP